MGLYQRNYGGARMLYFVLLAGGMAGSLPTGLRERQLLNMVQDIVARIVPRSPSWAPKWVKSILGRATNFFSSVLFGAARSTIPHMGSSGGVSAVCGASTVCEMRELAGVLMSRDSSPWFKAFSVAWHGKQIVGVTLYLMEQYNSMGTSNIDNVAHIQGFALGFTVALLHWAYSYFRRKK
jgi:membrane associated rhomboid family serine protease